MPFTVTIRKLDNTRRGNVSRTVEFEHECLVSDMIGAIDGLLRQCFPDDMRHRSLNLSRDTSMQAQVAERDVATVANNQPQPPSEDMVEVISPEGSFPRSYYTNRFINTESVASGRTHNLLQGLALPQRIVNEGEYYSSYVPPTTQPEGDR